MYVSSRDDGHGLVRKYHWIGIAVVLILSFPLHFIYEWTGENAVVGMFAPINESIWEHLKLVFFPLLIWWIAGYLYFNRKRSLSLSKWALSGTLSLFLSMLIIVSYYYILKGALRIENSFTNIFSLFVAIPISQLVAIYIYRTAKKSNWWILIAALFVSVTSGLFVYFTFSPPALPLFQES